VTQQSFCIELAVATT